VASEHERQLRQLSWASLAAIQHRGGGLALEHHRAALGQLALVLAGHDPQRTLERGYVLAQSANGEPIVTAAGARDAGELRLRFADESLPARILER
jgi:exodeoxyribonuclease VII large subunit